MKVLFIIQGEGRGHMTQALALEQMLLSKGHKVCAMVIGSSERRKIPAFFQKRTEAPIYPVSSPNFYFDKADKSIALWKTSYKNVLQIPQFLKQIKWISRLVKQEQPEVIINFYDVLGGFYFLLANPKLKRICIAHQYLAEHDQFPFANGSLLQKAAFRMSNFVTSMNCHKKLALSFDALESIRTDFKVVPPLLRKEITNLTTVDEDFILCYVVNKGYGEEILKWHSKNPKVKLMCFWDNYEQPDGWQPQPNIQFKHLNDTAFLDAMARCSGYVSTAGFESICEAAYLGKPVMMVPVKNQYEQACNALDAVRAGLGIYVENFNLGPFLTHLTLHKESVDMKEWVKQTEKLFISEIEAELSTSALRKLTVLEQLKQVFKNRSNLHQDYQPSELDYS